jgi:hypothetical protein
MPRLLIGHWWDWWRAWQWARWQRRQRFDLNPRHAKGRRQLRLVWRAEAERIARNDGARR